MKATETKPFQLTAPLQAALLQRRCACGGQTHSRGECEPCKKNKLQRHSRGAPAPVVPPAVHDVLASPGKPLDQATRSFFEPRFGHDFSKVRVHTDEKAAESAQAVNALAYAVGRDVVFARRQYAPDTPTGRKLLAHELTHTLQQRGQEAKLPQYISEEHESSEREADRIAETVTGGGYAAHASPDNRAVLRRKLKVDEPKDMIPNPGGKGLKQTNAETVEQYLNQLAPGSRVEVHRGTGVVGFPTGYCPGFAGGIAQGARAGFRIGHMIGSFGGHVPVLGFLTGVVGGALGAIIGGIAGLFGSKKLSAAGASATPTSATCLCDMVDNPHWWTIEINDSDHPRTMSENDPRDPMKIRSLPGGRVRVPSPNSPKLWGAASMTGKLENDPPWLVLAHELCGHAWLQERGREDEGETKTVPNVVRGPDGKLVVTNPELLTGNTPAPHGDFAPIQRENLIRQEHHMALRGFRVRDPFCGESFSRDVAHPEGPAEFTTGSSKGSSEVTFMEKCEAFRAALPENKDGRYRIDQQIPEPAH